MSADNYHLVDKRSDGTYVVLSNLSASVDYTKRQLNGMEPRWRTYSLDSALRAAHKLEREQYTEYGVQVTDRAEADL